MANRINKKIVNADVTIYSYWKDPVTDFEIYNREYIPNAFLAPVSVANKDRFGTTIAYDARLAIFILERFKPFGEYSLLPFDIAKNYWTINLGYPSAKYQNYIVRGEAKFIFTAGTATVVNAQVTAFKKEYATDNWRPNLVDTNFRGSEKLWHVMASLIRTV